MLRRTKIVATVGPSTDDLNVLTDMMRAGLDVVRLNASHGTVEDRRRRLALVREAARRADKCIGVLLDLGGPKIRIEGFRTGKVMLEEGQAFALDTTLDPKSGSPEVVGVAYKDLPKDVVAGDTLLLADGLIVLDVERVTGTRIETKVRVGGELSDRKGVNRQGGGISAPAISDKDREDIRFVAQEGIDYMAVSFARDAADIQQARSLLHEAGGTARIVAKIERHEAVANLAGIIDASDVVMVARGDLGVEMGYAELTGLQKTIIHQTRARNRVVITATQMMESMITSPVPTRAEVSDVANAVMDGTDAVMLSAESASGKYPVETVEAMARVCLEAEKSGEVTLERDFLNRVFTRVDQSIAMAALFTAYHLKVKAIASLTQSGSTALWMSRLNCGVPIYALTPEVSTRYKLSLFRDVYPLMLQYVGDNRETLLRLAEEKLLAAGVVKQGDLIVLTVGEPIGQPGGTNTMKIIKIGET